jgi:hypothetical protein
MQLGDFGSRFPVPSSTFKNRIRSWLLFNIRMSNKELAPYSTFDIHFNMVILEDPLETLRRYDLFRFNSRLNRLRGLKFLETLDGILIPSWQMSNKELAPYSTFDVHFNMVIWEDPLETLRR